MIYQINHGIIFKKLDDPNEITVIDLEYVTSEYVKYSRTFKKKTCLNHRGMHPGLLPEIKKFMFEKNNLKKKTTVSKTSRSWELLPKITE
jgi:hypothetical protein